MDFNFRYEILNLTLKDIFFLISLLITSTKLNTKACISKIRASRRNLIAFLESVQLIVFRQLKNLFIGLRYPTLACVRREISPTKTSLAV